MKLRQRQVIHTKNLWRKMNLSIFPEQNTPHRFKQIDKKKKPPYSETRFCSDKKISKPIADFMRTFPWIFPEKTGTSISTLF